MEPIALTDDDVARIANQLPGTFSAGLDGPDITCGPRLKRTIVRAVVKAINAADPADPAGTVRRSPLGVYALRTDGPDGPLATKWLATKSERNSYWRSDKDVANWPVVFSPSEQP